MKTIKPIAVHVDRIVDALADQGIDVRRTKALEIAAAAFGFHNTHECTAASKRGDLTPPAALPVCRVEIPGGGALIVLRDPVSGGSYAIDETFLDRTVDDTRRETYGPSPYGRLLDLSAVSGKSLPTCVSPGTDVPVARDGILRILVELDATGHVTTETVRRNVHDAIMRQRGEAGLSADGDEGMIEDVRTRIVEAGKPAVDQGTTFVDEVRRMMRDNDQAAMHVALIHHPHGIDIKLGTTLANVSRQVGDHVRENWNEAWWKNQCVPEGERIEMPETPADLDDDHAESLYFQALECDGSSNYVDYHVIGIDREKPVVDDTHAPEPFPGVPAGLYTVNASRDGHVFNETFSLEGDENEEDKGRELAAKAFGLDLDDYYDNDHDDEDADLSEDERDEARDNRNQDFDADIDSIEIVRASFDDMLLPILEASWAAAQKLPAGDPLKEVIRRQVMDAMPRPIAN